MSVRTLYTAFRFFLPVAWVIPCTVSAQPVEPNPSATAPPGSVALKSLPAAYNSGGNQAPVLFNYIRTWSPQVPVTNSTLLTHSSANAAVTTRYINGFGSALMDIRKNAPLQKDLVIPYDNRVLLSRLVFPGYEVPRQSKFQVGPYLDQKNYYLDKNPGEAGASYGYAGEDPFAGAYLEASVTAAPGKSFSGQFRENRVYVYANQTSHQVRIWNIETNLGAEELDAASRYAEGELRLRTTWDTHQNPVLEFFDKADRLILKEVRSGGAFLRTYYVYDDLGRLRYVVTPKAENEMMSRGAPWRIEHADLQKLCYVFDYDEFGQLVEKNTPGQNGKERFVYDRKRRKVLYQSPLLADQGKWEFYIYDSRDRVVMTGLVTSAQTRADWISGLAGSPSSGTLADYLVHGFQGTYPSAITDCDIRQFNYYDRYDQHADLTGRNFSSAYNQHYLGGSGLAVPAMSNMTHGLLTGTRTRIVDPTNDFEREWVNTVYFYDRYGNPVQQQTLNPWNDQDQWDVVATQFDFTGKKILEIFDHYGWDDADKPATKILKKFDYDIATGNLLRIQQSTDGSSLRNIVNLEYDAFGQVKKKHLGNVETQTYEYNIRGQLAAVNRGYVENPYCTNCANQTFGEILSYDYGFTEARYDGRIAGFQWRGAGTTRHAYGYSYDGAGRLTAADYSERTVTGPGNWNRTNKDYSVSGISYDYNGNLTQMKQRAPIPASSPNYIDDLTYHYKPGTDLLDRIEDAAVHTTGRDFQNGNALTTDYTYDDDGNLASDANKGITGITYNHLDLPLSVTTSSGQSVENIYDAAGRLLQKKITPSVGDPEIYRYWGPFTYRDDKLLYFSHEEGRCRWLQDSTLFKYDYFVKDHLNNVRSVITADITGPGNYVATHEVSLASVENLVFGGIDETRMPLPPHVAGPPGDTTNQYVIELEGSDPDKRVGTSLLLRVMAGDRFKVQTLAYYSEPEDLDENVYTDSSSLVDAIFNSFVTGFNPAWGEEGWGAYEQMGQLFTSSGNMSGYHLLKDDQTNPSLPRAYLNYLVYDNSMQLIAEKSGVIQVGAGEDVWQTLRLAGPDIEIDENGYVAIFLSNEQYRRVWFDNLYLVHYRGRLIEEHHYYPHGLTLHDDVAANHEPNAYLHQSKKLQKEAGLELYDFHARQYDAQIGRFWGIDPANEFPSGYTGMGNDPANLVDPNGMQVKSTSPGGGGGFLPPQNDYSVGPNEPIVIYVNGRDIRIGDLNEYFMGLRGGSGGGSGTGGGAEGVGSGAGDLGDGAGIVPANAQVVTESRETITYNWLEGGRIEALTVLKNPQDQQLSEGGTQAGLSTGLALTGAQLLFNEVVVPIALAEPTPFGEAIVGAINAGFLAYNLYQKSESFRFSKVGKQNRYSGMTGNEIISKYRKASIREEFPGEYLDKTWDIIVKEANRGQKSAQTAKKLLTDGRFAK